MKSEYRMILYILALLLLGCLLSACGGSSGSVSSTTVSGVVMAGPAGGTSVTIKNSSGAVVAGPVTTATDGSYTVAIPDSALKADLIFEASGGTFQDEATATTGVSLGALSAHVPAGTLAAGANVTIDPSSSIVQKLIAAGQTRAAAFTTFSSSFGYKPSLSIKPAFANVSSAASRPERLSGLRVAAFSQLTRNLGIQADKQCELINAIATDLADGTFDGGYAVGGKTVLPDIANRFGEALLAFQQSTYNKSKLKADEIGAPIFNKRAYTDTYKVEYLPGTMAATTGKTTFKIKLTRRSDGTVASGKTVTLRPYMYMSTKSHTTPMDAVVESSTPATYDCTVYYVMSSAMNGVPMGLWELKVTIDGTESAKFFPVVGMPMGSTTMAKLTGISDSIMGMTGPEKRTWFLFNDGLTAATGGSHTFKLFLATKEMGDMLTFPAVKVKDSLKNEAGALWTVDTILVEVSTDKTTWVAATDSGNGHWSAAGLTGLASGVSGSIHVRLTVNGEQKTTDGSAVGSANGYQTFTVTPITM